MPFFGTTELPCICCIGRIPVQLSCRKRGGTGYLIGFSEYTSPSTPPKKYRKQIVDGDVCNWDHDAAFGATGCTGYSPGLNISGAHRRDSGTVTYDSITGAVTGSISRTSSGRVAEVQSLADACALATPTSEASPPYDPYIAPIVSPFIISTSTTRTFTGDGACIFIFVLPVGDYRIYSTDVSVEATLSEEDTDADAIARLLAGASGIWTSWKLVGDGSGGTCINTDCCDAQWQQRTTGFNIAYNESQGRIVNNPLSLTGNANYNINVPIYRRVQGSGSFYTLFETLVFPVTTDINGDFPQFDLDVPNDIGFETYILTAFATISP